jgi:hypothetical protein
VDRESWSWWLLVHLYTWVRFIKNVINAIFCNRRNKNYRTFVNTMGGSHSNIYDTFTYVKVAQEIAKYPNDYKLASHYTCASDDYVNMKLVCSDWQPGGGAIDHTLVEDVCTKKANAIPQFKDARIRMQNVSMPQFEYHYTQAFPNCKMAMAKHYVDQFPDSFQIIAQKGACASADTQNANLLCEYNAKRVPQNRKRLRER